MNEEKSLNAAAELASGFEGFSAHPYLDTIAKPPVWTIGFGSTWLADGSAVTANTQPITRDQGVAIMAVELRHTLEVIKREIHTPLTDNQAAALESFIYNVGSGAFASSTLARKLRAGDYAGAAAEFVKWDMAGGKHIAGLLRRRQAERDLFLRVMASPPPAASTTASTLSTTALTADDLNDAELARIKKG